jgi:carboxymethylenebutenolidase
VCFAFDAHPPELPSDLVRHPRMAGGAGAEVLELTSADGTAFSAALAEAPEAAGGAPGVIVFPDVRGLYRFYVELAERFAQAGHPAIAIDYFGRTAGTGERGEDFDFWPHVEQTRVTQVHADADAARAALAARTGATSFVTVGFCFGGALSFLAATSQELLLDGVVGFYGRLSGGRAGIPSVLDHIGEVRCPVLGLFGGADEAIPTSEVDTFDRLLDEAGVEHDVVVYPGAPHSFFDRRYEEHAGACSDAWRRVLAFLEKVGAARAA